MDVLHESIRLRLEELKETYPKLAERIDMTIDRLPVLLVGQGGILDSARTAHAIAKKTNIPLNDIKNVTVVGPHNDHMQINFDTITVMHQGKEIRLKDHPAAQPFDNTFKEEIAATTRAGGKAVAQDNKGQSAVFGTAAAILPMVEASLSDKPVTLAASRKNPFAEVSIGELIDLSRMGAFQAELVPLSGPKELSAINATRQDAAIALQKVRERAGEITPHK